MSSVKSIFKRLNQVLSTNCNCQHTVTHRIPRLGSGHIGQDTKTLKFFLITIKAIKVFVCVPILCTNQ